MKSGMKSFVLGIAGGLAVLALYLIFSPEVKQQNPVNQNTNGLTQTQDMRIFNTRFAAPPQEASFIEAAENTVNAVVHIRTEMTQRSRSYDDFYGSLREFLYGNPFHGGSRSVVGFGSGVVLSADGYIVTNNHVVEGADDIEVTFNDKRKLKATIVGTDPGTDIALIKVEANGLPFLVFGNSDDVKIGEWVLAVGNPFNLTSTVTAGIVSAKARNINILGNRSSVDSFIQTDAVVNRGNSGGALVNTAGELIGINAAIASQTGVYEGYSFAIPGNIAKKVVDDIIRFGEPQRAFLGVEIREMDEDLAKEAGESDIKGVYVARVTDNGGAKEAGMRSGDVILALDNKPVNSLSQLLEAVGQHRPGETVELQLLRNGKQLTKEVTLRNQDGTVQVVKREDSFYNADLGANFERLREDEKNELGLTYGLKVTGVKDGVLRRGGIGDGFIIFQINGKKVDNKSDLEQAMNGSGNKAIRVQGMYPNGMKISFEFLK
ncbi:MAG: trypsin-like peptidase domain-containing protein [Bacteroidales bacterium]|nr:trypsin-like peptidase domain-containing protein [Bacteroidales bacterium]